MIGRRLLIRASGLAALAHGLGPGLAEPARGPALRVAAASDLKFALAEIARDFESATGLAVQVSYGASGNLFRQIAQGLPVDLFLSADEALVDSLFDAGLTQGRGLRYATGSLALMVQRHSAYAVDPELRGLMAQWGVLRKFAIANPRHAPYGKAAQQALEALGLWAQVQPRLVLGENAAQVTQFVAAGAAQAGLGALSLALAPELVALLRHVALPAALHAPLHQRMVMLKRARPQAQAFYAHLQSTASRAVLARYGLRGG